MKADKQTRLLRLLENREGLEKDQLKGKNFSSLDLSGLDMTSLDFTAAKFKKGILKKTDFSYSILKKARFQGADLEAAVLVKTDCRAADFSRASLLRADFSESDLQGVIFYKTNGEKVCLDRTLLKDTDLSAMNLAGCSAKKSDLTGARLEASILSEGEFSEARLTSACIADAEAVNTRFSGSDLRNADLKGAFLNGADFSGADLRGTDLSLSSLQGATLDGAAVEGADFRFSVGLSEEQKNRLQEGGAKVSRWGERFKRFFRFVFTRPWALAIFMVFCTALVFFGVRYFSDIRHRSISVLQGALTEAREAKNWERVLEIDLALLKKFRRAGDDMGIFNRSLDAGRMYRRMGEIKKSESVLQDLLEQFPNDREKEARVKLELAFARKESGDTAGAVVFLEQIKEIPMDKPFLFLCWNTLGDCYMELGRYSDAVAAYSGMLQEFVDDPTRFSRLLKKCDNVYDLFEMNDETRNTFFSSDIYSRTKNIYERLLEGSTGSGPLQKEIRRQLNRLQSLSDRFR
ncbi:MAG: pentapeptide repeat-containing protein [Candidatus Aminicenantes bacterium]|nr:pentapeptide repeat-containing protein [Candidatus Aminicenantes bacterium]